MRRMLGKAVSAALAVLLAAGVPSVAESALWGEFGLQEEMKMGRDLDAMVSTTMPIIEDPAVASYIQSVVDRIRAKLPPQPYAFPSKVVLQDMMNAFAAPGGFVFVFSGLIMNLEHESELAGVLSHEVAHITQRHIAGRMEKGRVVSIASMLGALAGIAAAAAGGGAGAGAAVVGSMAAGTSAMLGYSRADEDEADRFGVRYLAGAGWNPAGLGGALAKLRSQSWGMGSIVPAYLTTHPDINARISLLRTDLQVMDRSLRTRPENDGEFRRVQALLWGRHGDPAQAELFFSKHGAGTPVMLMGRGILASRQGRNRDAAAFFAEAMSKAPRDGLILREAAVFEYTAGDIRRARTLVTEALRLRPRDCYAKFYHARMLDDSGDRAGAQSLYRAVLKDVPRDAEVHMYFGRSLGASGRICEGFVHLAYSALYSQDRRRAETMRAKAASAARTDAERAVLKKYENDAKEHARIMKEAAKG
ncbi:MAG: M48 family metalloprotease [Mailhella sp.]|nr:M48 family metalloprotease [Mailhella sp.]